MRPATRPDPTACGGGILTPVVVGGGFLRTGCGPGPLEPDLDNSSEGNTARVRRPHPAGERPFLSNTITVNGQAREIGDGTTVDALLDELGVRRDYLAVAVNRDVIAKSTYAATVLHEGDRVEIVRPMGGG